MNNLLNKYEALNAALNYIGIAAANSAVLSLRLSGSYYEIVLRTGWMKYDCFVGCVSGEIAGLDYAPFLEETPAGISCAAFLAEDDSLAA